jgi:hypothetical protein
MRPNCVPARDGFLSTYANEYLSRNLDLEQAWGKGLGLRFAPTKRVEKAPSPSPWCRALGHYPTQWEALTMVAVQGFGNDHAVAFAGSQGNFQLNVYKLVMLHNVLTSIELPH